MNLSLRSFLASAVALGLVSGAPALAQPSIGNRNVIAFPEQRVCIEEISLSSKKTCYLIPHDDQVLRVITKNNSYYRYTIDKYNILIAAFLFGALIGTLMIFFMDRKR